MKLLKSEKNFQKNVYQALHKLDFRAKNILGGKDNFIIEVNSSRRHNILNSKSLKNRAFRSMTQNEQACKEKYIDSQLELKCLTFPQSFKEQID